MQLDDSGEDLTVVYSKVNWLWLTARGALLYYYHPVIEFNDIKVHNSVENVLDINKIVSHIGFTYTLRCGLSLHDKNS